MPFKRVNFFLEINIQVFIFIFFPEKKAKFCYESLILNELLNNALFWKARPLSLYDLLT